MISLFFFSPDENKKMQMAPVIKEAASLSKKVGAMPDTAIAKHNSPIPNNINPVIFLFLLE